MAVAFDPDHCAVPDDRVTAAHDADDVVTALVGHPSVRAVLSYGKAAQNDNLYSKLGVCGLPILLLRDSRSTRPTHAGGLRVIGVCPDNALQAGAILNEVAGKTWGTVRCADADPYVDDLCKQLLLEGRRVTTGTHQGTLRVGFRDTVTAEDSGNMSFQDVIARSKILVYVGYETHWGAYETACSSLASRWTRPTILCSDGFTPGAGRRTMVQTVEPVNLARRIVEALGGGENWLEEAYRALNEAFGGRLSPQGWNVGAWRFSGRRGLLR